MKKHHTAAAAVASETNAAHATPGAPSAGHGAQPSAGSELQAKLSRLEQERGSLDSALDTARQDAEEAGRLSAAATAARDDLQARCAVMAQNTAGPPAPFDKLGQAMVAAVAAYEAAQAAQSAYDAAQVAAGNRRRALEQEIAQVTGQLRQDELAALVAEYERRVQGAKLGHLSDQIRELARAAGRPLEAHSPLIDPEHTVLTGYPIQAWA